MRARRPLTVGIAGAAVVVLCGGVVAVASPLALTGDTAPSSSEMPSSGPSAGGLPGVPQGTAQWEPLVASPLPSAATSLTGLVAGFPRALAPAPESTVVSSSVAPVGSSAVQVALKATSTRSADAVLTAFRIRLAGLGFREVTGKVVGGSLAASFRRNDNDVTVTASPTASGSAYTVFAIVHARG